MTTSPSLVTDRRRARAFALAQAWSYRPSRSFLIAQGLGQASDAIALVVLATVLIQPALDNAPAALIETVAAATVPYAVVGPLAGAVADRWSRRRTLMATNAARVLCAGLVVAAVDGSHVLRLAAAVSLVSLARIAYAVRSAAIPEVAPDGGLISTESASLYVGTVAAIVGGAAGTCLLSLAPAVPMALAAALAAAAGSAVRRIRGELGGGVRDVGAPWRQTARHLLLSVGAPRVRSAIAVIAVHRTLLGALFAADVLIVASDLGLGATGYLVTAGITGASTLLGTVCAPAIAGRLSERALLFLTFAVPAGALGTAVSPGRASITLAASTVAFFGFQSLRVVADATIQAGMTSTARGRGFAAYDVVYNLSYLGGVAAALGWATSPSTGGIAAAVCAGYAVGALLVAVRCGLTTVAVPSRATT